MYLSSSYIWSNLPLFSTFQQANMNRIREATQTSRWMSTWTMHIHLCKAQFKDIPTLNRGNRTTPTRHGMPQQQTRVSGKGVPTAPRNRTHTGAFHKNLTMEALHPLQRTIATSTRMVRGTSKATWPGTRPRMLVQRGVCMVLARQQRQMTKSGAKPPQLGM